MRGLSPYGNMDQLHLRCYYDLLYKMYLRANLNSIIITPLYPREPTLTDSSKNILPPPFSMIGADGIILIDPLLPSKPSVIVISLTCNFDINFNRHRGYSDIISYPYVARIIYVYSRSS